MKITSRALISLIKEEKGGGGEEGAATAGREGGVFEIILKDSSPFYLLL